MVFALRGKQPDQYQAWMVFGTELLPLPRLCSYQINCQALRVHKNNSILGGGRLEIILLFVRAYDAV